MRAARDAGAAAAGGDFPRVPIGRKIYRGVRPPFPLQHREFSAALAAARVFFS